MLYLLLGWLILLFFFSYYMAGKDFFAPSTMMTISFVFACSLSIYILSDISYAYGLQTVLIIGSCLSITLLIGIAAHTAFRGVRIQPAPDRATPIPNLFTVFALLLAAVVIFAQLREIIRVAGTSGMFGQIMGIYRNRHGYSTDTEAQYPMWLRLMLNVVQSLFILYAFNLIKFFRQLKKSAVVMQASFLGLTVLSSLLTSGRFSVLTNLIACVFLFHMIRIQRLGRYKTYRFGFLVRIIVIIVAAAWFFYWVKEFVGRVSNDTLLDYTAHYLGTGIINLDLFLKSPPMKSNIWGKETFYSLINNLRRMGIINVDYYYVHKEFRAIAGMSMGNVYTALRDYLYDFGPGGMYLLHSLYSLFFAVFYEAVKKSRSNIPIIIFSMMYYCNIMYVFSSQFYSSIISLGFASKCIIVYVLYKLLMEKKLKLKWVPPIWLEEDETVVTDIKQAYVSFDIFDTLIKRSVARPADLFRMMEQNGPDVPEHFAEKRMEAERAAHARLGVRTGLADIYEELLPLYGARTNDLMALEIQYEIAGCRPNPDCIDLLNRCVAQDKTVLLLSDMYLPSSVLRKMLDRCGVYHYDRLYVSCEEGACKADGSLFWKVVADQEIRPTELCHIGDNRRSDGLEPWRVGVHIRHVKNGQKALCAGDRELPADAALYERTLQACIRNCEEDLDSDYARLGCETFGPLLAGFTAWLREQLLRDGIQDVYFMARDGYTMKQAFDSLGDGRFRTHYLYCSRRSFTVPLLWKHPELQDIFKNVTIQPRMTLRVLILRLGLEPEDCAEQARACGLDLDFVFENDSLRTSEQVAAFYESIREQVIANSKREYEALLAYIHSCGMQGRVAVVDIGRHGTMQNALEQLIAEAQLDIQVKGYYVGVSPDAPLVNEGRIQAAGYLHERGRGEEILEKLAPFMCIFESIFLAQHGSVKRFVMRDGQPVPELYAFEYEVEEDKSCDEIAIIREYQAGALALVREMNAAFPGGLPQIPYDVAPLHLLRMGLNPTLREAELWGDFRVFDNVVMLMARPRGLGSYLAHPARLKRDFIACPWKIGFLRRLLRVPLPYEKIYLRMKRAFHRGGSGA